MSMANTETHADLRDIAGFTQQITHLTKKRALIGEKRKAAAKKHHFEEHVPVAQLAKAMGISPTAAYRLVHGDGSKNARRTEAE